ncbi:hypothetical protein [Enhygromyxa salina]|uniref:hypothetical protein n=1 Tax=Enhygromyxa salina TaxID=215803 RepID=UPI0011B27AA5|nr:hypothetical protein [Enhygromyxa salina]
MSAPILRSQAELEAQIALAKGEAWDEESVPACTLDELPEVDWDTEAVAVIVRRGRSSVDRMSVSGRRLHVVTRGIRQCGGQELMSWQGTLLVVVPAKVQSIEWRSLRTKPCPNRRGPRPP